VGLHDDWPAYDFRTHKGYVTAEHEAALAAHGPSPVHRMRFVNVRRAAGLEPVPGPAPDAATSLGHHQPAPGGDTVEEDA
jgi:ribonuclease HII